MLFCYKVTLVRIWSWSIYGLTTAARIYTTFALIYSLDNRISYNFPCMYAFILMYISINIVTIFNIIFFRDYSDILNAESLDLVSPWLAFDHVEAFPIVKSFLTHLLIHYKFEEFIQIPTNALIVTIPRLFEFFGFNFSIDSRDL